MTFPTVWQLKDRNLLRPKEEWPQEDATTNQAEVEKENRKVQIIGAVTASICIINCNNYSSWKKLLRVTAWVLRLKENCLAKLKPEDKKNTASQGPLSPQELEESRTFWIKEEQKSLKDRQSKN